MQRFALLLILLAVVAKATAQESATTQPQRIALVVGISDYFHKNMEDLKYAEKDAVDVGDSLTRLGFEVTQVTGRNATRHNVNKTIDAFLESASKLEAGSIVFIMFSGHGQQLRVSETDPVSKLTSYEEVPFFCPRDAVPFDVSRDSTRGKSAAQVAEEMNLVSLNRLIAKIDSQSNSLNNLLVIDACRNNPSKGKSAGITGSAARELPRGISILFAAKSGQKSWESSDPKVQQGVMTHYLLKGLSGAAENRRREITWSRLVTYIQEEVEYAGWQLAGGRGYKQNPHTLTNSEQSIFLYSPAFERTPDMLNRKWRLLWEREKGKEDPLSTGKAIEAISKMDVRPGDWPMWGGWHGRNNTPFARDIPTDWNLKTGKNIKWFADIGHSEAKAVPAIANGKIFIGTNNLAGLLPRYPKTVDLGVLLCLDEQTGRLLWHYSAKKLETGRVHDWPLQGILSTPYADGDRIWFVDNRNVLICADANGFLDGENDGPFKGEKFTTKDDADIIWRYDIMNELGVFQHNKATCSPVCFGDKIFVLTGNGVDEAHTNIPAPNAPSFICLDRNTGKLLWQDNSPGANVLHGQWSSPTIINDDKQPQVLFPAGDGWLYSFTPDGKLLWKFDCNPKTSVWELGGRGTRNSLICLPVVYDGLVYVAVGQDPEHGESAGHLWCIDPTKRGDISPTLAMKVVGNRRTPIPHKRQQAVDESIGEVAIDNPNSGVVWHYHQFDADSDGQIEFEEEYHRMMGAVVVDRGVVYTTDFSGLSHAIDAKSGKPLWTYDLLAQAWGSPLVTNGTVFQPDDDGDVTLFDKRHRRSMKFGDEINEIWMEDSISVTPVVANGVLFLTTRSRLYAIEKDAKLDPAQLKKLQND